MKITSFDQIHNRNYKQEKLKKAGIKPQSFVEKLRETTALDPTFATAALLGIEAGKEAGIRALANHTKQFKSSFSVDTAFNTIRKLENRLPLFNIPLRSSQIGDVLTPFVSDEALRWNYNRSEIIESKQGVLRLKDEFQFLNEMAGRDILPELQQGDSRVYFEKTGKVYGNIYLENDQGTKTLGKDVFRMQRPSTKTGAISAIWDAGKRPAHFYKPLSDTWEEPLQKLGFSNEMIKRIRFGGGVARTIIGETTHEFFKGMNRFLKEPVPGLNRLLDSTEEISVKSKLKELGPTGKPFQSVFGHLGEIKSPTNTPFGRLPRWLRPYVHEGYWDKTAGRMAVALAAKGSIYTKLIPSLYGALDYSREKMGGSSAVVTTPLYAAIGMGIGSLVNSGDFNAGVFKNTKLITKTQMGGAIAGAVIGALPVFDKGITAGIGSLYGSANILGARVWDTVGGHKALKRQEELFPGMTNPMTGVGFVLGGGFVGYFNSQLGTAKGILDTTSISQYKLKVGQLNPEEVLKQITSGKLSEAVTDDLVKAFREERIGKIFSVKEAAGVLRGEVKDVKTVVGLMALTYSELAGKAEIPKEFLERVTTVEGSEELASRLFTHMDELSDIAHKASKASSFEYMSKGFFGRMIDDGKDLLKGRPSFTRGALKGGLAFAGIAQLGAIIAGPVGGNLNPVNLIPGWMISLTGGGYSGKEAEDVYTGKKEVAIRKGRFWSLGSSPWEGSKVEYFRKHRSVLMQSDAEDNALYGSTDEKIAYDPILHPLSFLLDDEFKYHHENRLSLMSPTPLSGRAFSDVPILGDLLGATIGELIKPTKEFRASEWKGSGGAVRPPPGSEGFHEMRSAPAVSELGGLSYQARDQNSMYSVTKDTFKRMTEQAGLRGFMLSAALEDVGYRDRTYDPVIERSDSLLSNRAKFWSLNLGDPMGTCFVGSTLVNTIEGRKPIEEIKIGEKVLSLDGRYRKVIGKLVIKQHDKQLVKIKTSTIGTEFICTDNHWIPVLKRNYYSNGHAKPIKDVELVDTQAKEIKPGDYLVVPIIKPESYHDFHMSFKTHIQLTDSEHEWLYWDQTSENYIRAYENRENDPLFWNRKRLRESFGDEVAKAVIARHKKGNIRRYSNYIEITPDLLYWLGWYTAEGCANKYRIQFTLGSHEKEYAERLRDIADKELGLGRGELKDNGSSIQLRFSNKYLVNFLNEQFGKGAKNKRIPEWIKLQDKKFLASYLSGLLIGDGWSEGFTSSSKDLTLDVFQCLLRLNVRGGLTLDYIEKSKGVYLQGTLKKETKRHNYRVANSHIERFQAILNEQVPEEIEELGGKSFIADGKLYVQVRSIEPLDISEPVYDLEIEDLHYYVVEEIAVHNTEATRRYLTKDRNTYYNPLSNMAPSWLPENDYWQDFKHGNYFSKVKEGWLRLPGAGYVSLNPELQGLHPENYSIGHKYKILSDVAYGSNEYLAIKEKAKQSIASGSASKRDLELIATANQQLGEKKIKRSFRDYQFDKEYSREREFTVLGVADDGSIITAETGKRQLKLAGLDMSMAAFTRKKLEEENFKTIADAERAASESRSNALYEMRQALQPGTKIKGHMSLNDDDYGDAISELYIPTLNEKVKELGAEVDKDSSFRTTMQYNAVQRFFGKAWESYTHNADLPITPGMAMNKIAPFQPHSKFVKRLTPIELYAQTRVYGRELQMWQNYGEDFIGTAFNEVKAKMFGDSIPAKVEYQRTMIEYFDKLKWLKYHSLEQASQMHDNSELSEYYAQKKKQTMYGADPYRGYSDIFRALPGTERDFYREFVNETDPDNQARILELAPEAMKRIYIAQWQNKRIKSLGNKAEAGIADASEKAELKNLYKLRESEGFVKNHELEHQYKQETQGSDLSYADWVRLKELKEYFKAFKLPKANFVGYDPRVDLEDVKLKVAQNEGLDVHNLGLWDQQAESVKRKPYVDGGASLLSDWHETPQTESEFEADVRRMIREASNKIHLAPVRGLGNRVIVQAQDTREIDVRRHLQKGMF